MPSDRQAEAYALIAAEYRICNLVPSRGTATDWTFYDAVGAGVLAAPRRPAAVDLRADWWEVADQDRTGSSVGWAAGDGVMRYQLVTADRLRRDEHVSARYVWMAAKESGRSTGRPGTFIKESPTSLKAAADVCRRYGVVTADLLPFETPTALYTGPANTFWAAAAQRRATSYFNLGLDLEQWRFALAQGCPVLAGLSVDASCRNATQTGGELDKFEETTVRGGTAVCAVGYRDDGRIILRNSWGTAWGDRGFAYATPEYVQAAFFPESYVLTVR
jgi:hypothetical protein